MKKTNHLNLYYFNVSVKFNLNRLDLDRPRSKYFNPQAYKQIHTPTWYKVVQEELKEPFPRVFDMLQYFETILRSVDNKVRYMGEDAAGGLCRLQIWWPYLPPSWMLPKLLRLRLGDYSTILTEPSANNC